VPATGRALPDKVKSEAIYVLTIKEAATRLGISASEMEAMVKRGTVKSLVAGAEIMGAGKFDHPGWHEARPDAGGAAAISFPARTGHRH